MMPTLPAIERPHGFTKVYTKDVSRSGISFLTTHQLYPSERVILWTQKGKLTCEVARCLKHNDKCFEVGAVYRNQSSP